MAVNLSPIGGVAGQFFDNNGDPLSGGKIFTYAAGTTTPSPTYTTSAGGTPHANPIILDAAGRVPGGEIWLTDGAQYKFVIKTSVDVQIGSYDNIIGINSNFVNYTNAQEIQTATAGQTVFTLTTMQYQPGTNSLSVFVDGVNQYGPGALYAYQETSSTVVTFTSGLHVGAEVKFTTSAINASSYGDAEQISYTPPFTGSVTTNVELRLAQYISVKDFGAVGNGIVDDTAAIQNAITQAFVAGKTVFIPAGTYLCTSTLNLLDNTTVFGEGPNSALHFTPSGGGQTAGITVANKTNFAIKSLRVYGDGLTAPDLTWAIRIYGSTKGIVSNCHIDTAYLGVFVGDVSIAQSDTISIDNNTISNIGLNGIAVNTFGTRIDVVNNSVFQCGINASLANVGAGIEYRGAVKGVIAANSFTDLQYGPAGSCDGIRLEYATEGITQQVYEVVVSGNVISNFSGYGIRAQYVKFCAITGNTIRGSATNVAGISLIGNNAVAKSSDYNSVCGNAISNIAGGVGIRIEGDTSNVCTGNTVSGNTINVAEYGITLANAANNQVSANTVSGANVHGVFHTSGGNNSLLSNKIYGSLNAGVNIIGGVDVVLANNTVNQNGTYGIYIDVGVTGTKVFGNVLYNNTTADWTDAGINTEALDNIGVPLNKVGYGTAPPTTGLWSRGNIVWNTTPSAGGTPGWVCVATGTPGTWKAMANIAV